MKKLLALLLAASLLLAQPVTAAAEGDGGHVGGIGLEHEAVEGHHIRQHFGQVRLLEGEYAADAKDETVEL